MHSFVRLLLQVGSGTSYAASRYIISHSYQNSRKEEYANGNSFFHLDIQNSFVEPILISLLMDGMSEYHVDRMVTNLQLHDVYIRVGSIDRTVHPWFLD